MRRIALPSSIILPALLAVLPGCGKDKPLCVQNQLECGGSTCVDPMSDPLNCGACGSICSEGAACVAGDCTASCEAPLELCGVLCVDTATTAAHCGSCDHDCGPGVPCVVGTCAGPLALLQTSYLDRTIDRDLYVLQDVTFALTRLDSTMFEGDRVRDHAILPDGRVVVLAAQTEDVFELWLGSPQGGTLTRVNGPLVDGGDVLPGFRVSADGRRLLYRADQQVDDRVDLYAVSLATPGQAVRLSPTTGEVSSVFALSADGGRAAYVGLENVESADNQQAFTVDLTAASPTPRVVSTARHEVWDLRLAASGERVVYRAYDPQVGRLALHVASTVAPGDPIELGYVDGAEGQVEGYQLAPAGDAVVFTAGNRFLQTSLWRSPLPPTDEADRLVDGSKGNPVRADIVPSRDGAQVYYRQDDQGHDRVYRVAVATHATTPLTPHTEDQGGEATDFLVSADERSLVFRGGADGAEGGIPRPETDGDGFVRDHAPSINYVDLTVSPPPAPVVLSKPLDRKGEEGIGLGFRVTADGRRVLYRADHERDGFSDAYLVDVRQPDSRRKVSPTLDDTTDATDVSVVSLFE